MGRFVPVEVGHVEVEAVEERRAGFDGFGLADPGGCGQGGLRG